MSALSSAQQSEVKAWEEEILACEHTLMLQQEKDLFPGYSESAGSFLSYGLQRQASTMSDAEIYRSRYEMRWL